MARIVVCLRGVHGRLPSAPIGLGVRSVVLHDHVGEIPLGGHSDDLDRNVDTVAGLDPVVPVPTERITEDVCGAGEQVGEEAHGVRVIRDHQEIQWSGQAGLQPRGRNDLVPPCELVGLVQTQPVAECASVDREGRVKMGVAPEYPTGEVAAGVGRVGAAPVHVVQRRGAVRWRRNLR